MALLISLVGCKKTASKKEVNGPIESLYELETIGAIDLRISAQDIEKLRSTPREWVEASATVLGEQVAGVSVRLKGHRSMRRIDKKPSFKLRFAKGKKGRRVHGVKAMILNNMVEDPTMMREFLGYRLYRAAGVLAPRVGYVQVTLNGEAYGLYALIESIDADFLKKHAGSSKGKLYEGEYGCDLYPGDVSGFDRDHGKKDRSELADLAQSAESGLDALLYQEDAPILRQEFLAYLAVSAFIADFDGYRHAHNYRIFYQQDKRAWRFVPWGIDRAFIKDLGVFDSYGRAAKMCFANAKCRVDFLRVLAKVTDEFERLNFDAGVSVLQSVTRDAALADPRKPYSNKKVDRARKKLRKFIASRPAAMRKHLSCLTNDGELDADGDGYGCLDCNDADPAVHPGAPESCDGVDNDCSTAIDDSPQCPCQEVTVGERQFHLCNQPRSFWEAQKYCAEAGLELARISNLEESKALYRLAKTARDDRWWIGLGDQRQEGQFRWRDGSIEPNPLWTRGEPDNDACGQDCVALAQGKDGLWHDAHCAAPRPFICSPTSAPTNP